MPPPKSADGHRVLDAWGFTYRTGLVWVKDRIGMGWWVRRRHSEKPEAVYELLERAWPEWHGNRRELFQRAPRPGWLGWGNEVPA